MTLACLRVKFLGKFYPKNLPKSVVALGYLSCGPSGARLFSPVGGLSRSTPVDLVPADGPRSSVHHRKNADLEACMTILRSPRFPHVLLHVTASKPEHATGITLDAGVQSR